jgi:diguanylate cyclase (GGDEF)-like protein/PAS domain S-box-containing protein
VNLAAALIPPTLEAHQALRLRRFAVASLSYVLATAMLAIGWMFDAIPATAAFEAVGAFLALNLGLYLAIRSGFNLRFEDPSLTRFQILAAISILMCIVYRMDDGREIALFACFIVFLFGIFRLNARQFVVITLYTLASYALVINLLMHFRPEAIRDVQREWMSCLGLAGFLPCFNIIGAQINTLRRKLRDSESRSRLTFELAASGMAHVSLDGRFLLVNRKLCAILGYSEKELLGGMAKDFSLPEDRDKTDAGRASLYAGDLQSMRCEKRYLRKNGTTAWVDLTLALARGADGKPLYEIVVFDDSTERKRSEQALRDSAEELHMIADSVPAMIVSWDENLLCRFANKAYAEFFGPATEVLVGKHAREILGATVYREVEPHFMDAMQGYPVGYKRTHELRSGQSRYLDVRLLPDLDDRGNVRGFFQVIADITEYKLTEERIQRVAHHDGLTELPNRLLFNDRLSQALHRAKRDSSQVALLYLDLDRFKPVNDSLGHSAGDELLKEVAARIRRQVRESDTVARVGGDEFTVILPDVSSRDKEEAVARKITAALAEPFRLGDQMRSTMIGISIGVSVYPADAADADALIKAADAAMYRAKQAASSLASRAALVRQEALL